MRGVDASERLSGSECCVKYMNCTEQCHRDERIEQERYAIFYSTDCRTLANLDVTPKACCWGDVIEIFSRSLPVAVAPKYAQDYSISSAPCSYTLSNPPPTDPIPTTSTAPTQPNPPLPHPLPPVPPHPPPSAPQTPPPQTPPAPAPQTNPTPSRPRSPTPSPRCSPA